MGKYIHAKWSFSPACGDCKYQTFTISTVNLTTLVPVINIHAFKSKTKTKIMPCHYHDAFTLPKNMPKIKNLITLANMHLIFGHIFTHLDAKEQLCE